MRRTSEAKRDAILDVAAGLFGEVGFERASMAEISARVGGSKATLYSYFDSKEALFFEVLFRPVQSEFQLTHQALSAGGRGPGKGVAAVRGASLKNFERWFRSRFIHIETRRTDARPRQLHCVIEKIGHSRNARPLYQVGIQSF
ncbi:TetR/AcrR family transcriptional regulator [Ralstonia solanacearum]|uniref:TetR/AcrR family transcriptional regulator n=1 Tax=Ralstonia solanacearum TaxID=305 RepID=UPI003CC6228A